MTEFVGSRSFEPARMMLLRAFLAQNVAIGCAFGGFSVAILALEARFDTSRAMAEMFLALAVLTMSALSPMVAGLIVRIGLRATMLIGVGLSAVGYAALAVAPGIGFALAAVTLAIGPGAAMFGSIPASILAGGWFPQSRGRALGIANMPLFIALVPLLGLGVIERFGLPAFFLCLAGLHLLLLPLMLGVADAPAGADECGDHGQAKPDISHPLGAILAQPILWVIVIGDGLLNAANIAGAAHIVPIAVERGTSPNAAVLLLSIMGASSIFGSALSGFLCDRLGAARTLALAGLGLAISWGLIQASAWLPNLMLAMVLSGACGAAVFPPINVLVVQVFGVDRLPRALGLIGVLTLPFTFLMSPAAGWVRDVKGDYTVVELTFVILCVSAAMMFAAMGRMLDRRKRAGTEMKDGGPITASPS